MSSYEYQKQILNEVKKFIKKRVEIKKLIKNFNKLKIILFTLRRNMEKKYRKNF